jgi:hypothetical protein
VFLNPQEFDADTMMDSARELGHSENTFVYPLSYFERQPLVCEQMLLLNGKGYEEAALISLQAQLSL